MALPLQPPLTPPGSPDASNADRSPGRKGRLIMVSNRLPVSITRLGDGRWDFTPSAGGLASSLRSLASGGVDFLWYGWTGVDITEQDVKPLKQNLLDQHKVVPVLLKQQIADLYYDGYSNTTIWPLFHHQMDKVLFNGVTSAAYQEANEAFAATIAPEMQDGDHVWVHDYHLMLLPQLLRKHAREVGIKIHIGWFLHTPFPEKDIFNVLPSKFDILDGILGADVVGFQTDEARQNFSTTCSHIMGHGITGANIVCNDREVRTGTFPIGVEPCEFQDRLQKYSVQDFIRNMKKHFNGAKVVIGVDRLDCIKGIPQKLCAFDKFLERYPQWVGKAILVQIAIPSRCNLDAHRKLKKEIQQLVGEINGKYGRVMYVPIHFVYNSIPPDELTALYTAADACFITSTRDGMNLVCYEYVACHNEKAVKASQETNPRGVLILSRFAGAANVLDGSLVVNPWDQESCADALQSAFNMSATEASRRMKLLGDKVEQQTSSHWGSSFVKALEQISSAASLDVKLECYAQ